MHTSVELPGSYYPCPLHLVVLYTKRKDLRCNHPSLTMAIMFQFVSIRWYPTMAMVGSGNSRRSPR